MKIIKSLALLSTLSLLLAACGSAQGALSDLEVAKASDDSIANSGGQSQAEGTGMAWLVGQTREDAQGAVTVVITAKDLNAENGTLEFEVAMDTHSVDLNMDLVPLATLTTDTGLSVDGLVWTTSESGHHVSGVLSFPATLDGVSILDGATELTLTIRNVDAAERIFIWQAQS